jgi:hypothetical protein
MAKLATLLYFKHTDSPFETRDTASSVGSFITDQRKALALARRLENGDYERGELIPDGFRPGHGITIIYGTGRRRQVAAV